MLPHIKSWQTTNKARDRAEIKLHIVENLSLYTDCSTFLADWLQELLS